MTIEYLKKLFDPSISRGLRYLYFQLTTTLAAHSAMHSVQVATVGIPVHTSYLTSVAHNLIPYTPPRSAE